MTSSSHLPAKASHLTILVLALAFLAASFPARNSDLWFHLATGRLLAQGQFSFGTDPFAYTTQQVYWVCHSWLFDWALYGLRGPIGDAGLIVLKALLVTALAGLMLRVRRDTGASWLPAICTTLAILALSPRLLLQPTCVSYFLLGLTLWLLWRQQRAGSVSDGTPVAYASGSLLLVFLLWVNVDEWFLLGPLLAALFWLGGRLQPARSTSDGSRRTPGWIVPAGLAVCLINPFTYHAFTLPAELSSVTWTSGLREDERFRALFSSSWNAEHFHAALRLDASVLAYYVLTLFGLASFLLHRPALRDWRLLVWLPFALLAAWQARLIPFFAVVAAPITALNWQDIVAARSVAQNNKLRSFLGPTYLTLLLSLLSLMLLTWLGWLAGYDREERRVAWGVQEDPALRHAAQTLEGWRRRGLLPSDERIFSLTPEVAHYSAWFCPGERHFFDHRYPLFPQAAREYETVCRALLSSRTQAGEQRDADWQQVLRDHKVGLVVFYDRDPQRLFTVLQRLAGDPAHWTLLDLAGQALIAGWNNARPCAGFDPLAFDADRLAFGPRDARAPDETPPVPAQGPVHLPARRGFWDRLTRPVVPASGESAVATMYLHYFQDSEAAQVQHKMRLLKPAYAASLAGLAAHPPAIPQVLFQLVSSRNVIFPSDLLLSEQLGPFFAPLMYRSAALPLLAIRSARRAVAANPEEANAWLRLGQAYLLLRDLTYENTGAEKMVPLAQMRHVQIVAALEQAVRLDPNLEPARHELAFLYGGANALDQSLEHRREEARLSREAGPRPGETTEEFDYRIGELDKDLGKLVKLVEIKRKDYASAAGSSQGDRVAQARLALHLGLARQAVEESLLASPADLLGAPGMRLELELLLSLGRVEEVRGILNHQTVRNKKRGLGYCEYNNWPAYEWLHVLQAAAVGDYAQGREDLRAIRAVKHDEQRQLQMQVPAFQRRDMALLLSTFSETPPFLPAFAAVILKGAVEERTMVEQALQVQQADLCVLEGLLALEQGDVEAARSAFKEAKEADIPFVGRSIAFGYLRELRREHSFSREP